MKYFWKLWTLQLLLVTQVSSEALLIWFVVYFVPSACCRFLCCKMTILQWVFWLLTLLRKNTHSGKFHETPLPSSHHLMTLALITGCYYSLCRQPSRCKAFLPSSLSRATSSQHWWCVWCICYLHIYYFQGRALILLRINWIWIIRILLLVNHIKMVHCKRPIKDAQWARMRLFSDV